MSEVAVYRFYVKDPAGGENFISPRFATLSTIERRDCQPITSTRKMVDESQIDGGGFFPRRPRI
jgi:hypothetical protein